MKLTLKQIAESSDQLYSLREQKLPAKVAYRITRLIEKLKPALTNFNTTRNDLIKKLGEEDPETKFFTVKKENEKEFHETIAEILSVEEEVDFEPISIDLLGDLSVAPKDLPEWLFSE